MAKVNAKRRAVGEVEVQPWQLFDLIGGTSTGGYVLSNIIHSLHDLNIQ